MSTVKPLSSRQSRALFRAESRRIAAARRVRFEAAEDAALRAKYSGMAPIPPVSFPWVTPCSPRSLT